MDFQDYNFLVRVEKWKMKKGMKKKIEIKYSLDYPPNLMKIISSNLNLVEATIYLFYRNGAKSHSNSHVKEHERFSKSRMVLLVMKSLSKKPKLLIPIFCERSNKRFKNFLAKYFYYPSKK